MNAAAAGGGGGGAHRAASAPPPSWFLGAPVSKAFTTIIVTLYVAAEMGEFHDALALDLDRLLNDGEVWRLITCHLTFSSIGELVFGLLLLCPLMRRFEREMGSRKFGTYALFSTGIAMSWELMLSQILALHDEGEDGGVRASGPYSLIGALLYLFYRYTPRLHPRFVAFLGLDFSEKALTFFLAFQLVCSQGFFTIIPSLCGFLSGYLCTAKALPFARWEMPDFFYRLCGAVGSPFVESTAPTVVAMRGRTGTRQQMQQQNQQQQQQQGQMRPLIPPPDARFDMMNYRQQHPQPQQQPPGQPQPPAGPPQYQNLPPPPAPPEEVVGNLVSMGFEREAVVRVLQQCDNNPEVAANRLLNEE